MEKFDQTTTTYSSSSYDGLRSRRRKSSTSPIASTSVSSSSSSLLSASSDGNNNNETQARTTTTPSCVVGSLDGQYHFNFEPPNIRSSAIKNNPMAGFTFGRFVTLLACKELKRCWGWFGGRKRLGVVPEKKEEGSKEEEEKVVLTNGDQEKNYGRKGGGGGVDWHLYPHRILALLGISLFNSVLALVETVYVRLCLGNVTKMAREDNQAPVFILGHPRTGTTMLHSLLALDTDQFCVCSTFCAGFPTAFLWFESIGKILFSSILTPTRPMDNMPLHFDLPQEDELATCLLSGGFCSPYMSIYFMRDEKQYRQYQTMRFVDDKEKSHWTTCFLELCTKLKARDILVQKLQQQEEEEKERKRAITMESSSPPPSSAGGGGSRSSVEKFLSKIVSLLTPKKKNLSTACSTSLDHIRPRRLLLKSPCHTGRVQHILSLYPDAKFIYIHRNPYEVFLSGAHMASTTYGYMCLQRPTDAMMQEYILAQGEILVGEYGRCKRDGLLNEKNLVEVSFEQLTSSPYGTISHIYKSLNLVNETTFPSSTTLESDKVGPNKADGDATTTWSYPLRLQQHCSSLKGYKRNTFGSTLLDAKLIQTIRERWKDHFVDYGYDMSWPQG